MINSFNDYRIRVIQLQSNATRPKDIYGTIDILNTTDSAGYTTNKWFDYDTSEVVYETYKDVLISISVRNGDYTNIENQDKIAYLADKFHKSLTYENVLKYLDEKLNATVKSTQQIRQLPDYTPTGIGEVSMFNMVLRVVDQTRVYSTDLVEHISVNDITIPAPTPSCNGLTISNVPTGVEVSRSLNNVLLTGRGKGILTVASLPIVPRMYFNLAQRDFVEGYYELLFDDDTEIRFVCDISKNSFEILINSVSKYLGVNFNGGIEVMIDVNEITLILPNSIVITHPILTTNLFVGVGIDFSKNIIGFVEMVFTRSDFASPSISNIYDICGDEING